MKQLRLLTPLLVIFLIACGGEETTKETYTVSGSVSINDPEFWIDGQTIEIGLFTEETSASYSTTISQASAGEAVAFELSNVEEGVYTCKVFAAENGKYKADIYSDGVSQDISSNTELGNMDVNILTYTRVQDQVFDRCTQCHGASAGDPYGDLLLLEDESYSNLVDIQSAASDLLRVKSGDAENSFLIHVLNNDDLPFEHASSATATTSDIELVELWINNGALNN